MGSSSPSVKTASADEIRAGFLALPAEDQAMLMEALNQHAAATVTPSTPAMANMGLEDVCMPCRSFDEDLVTSMWDRQINFSQGELKCLIEGKTDLRERKAEWEGNRLLTPAGALAAARNLPAFIAGLPKAELHCHIEGTLTPHRAYLVAAANYPSLKDTMRPDAGAKRREAFTSLLPFLMEYNAASAVLKTQEDFKNMTLDYMRRASENRVAHCELFFDPQAHCYFDISGDFATSPGAPVYFREAAEVFGAKFIKKSGGVYDPKVDGDLKQGDPEVYDKDGVGPRKLEFETVYRGLVEGLEEGLKLSPPVHAKLILCFLRDRSCAEALAVLKDAEPFIKEGHIISVGMDNREGAITLPDGTEIAPANPPSKFKEAYDEAMRIGIPHKCAHAGEEGDAGFIWEAIKVLGCERIDHGVRCLEDPELVDFLARQKNTTTGTMGIPITFCPCSNHRLQVIPRFFGGSNPIRQFLNKGVLASINSDDPAYFFMGPVSPEGRAASAGSYDGFVSSNYMRTQRDSGLSPDELVILALDSFKSSFLEKVELDKYAKMVAEYCTGWNELAVEQLKTELAKS